VLARIFIETAAARKKLERRKIFNFVKPDPQIPVGSRETAASPVASTGRSCLPPSVPDFRKHLKGGGMKVPGPALAAVLLFLVSAVPSGAESPSVDLSQPIGADQAVRLALARNYDVRLAQDQLGQARAGRLQAYGGMVPRLTADYGYTHASRQSTQQPPNPLGSGSVFTSDSRGYNVSADQT